MGEEDTNSLLGDSDILSIAEVGVYSIPGDEAINCFFDFIEKVSLR
jgi:hypothetical protein